MKKVWIISAILVALLTLGCDSGNTPPDIVLVPESTGEGIVESTVNIGVKSDENISVEGNNTEGKFVTTANIYIPLGTQPKDTRGEDACIEDPCSIEATQLCVKDTSECSNKQADKIASDVPNVQANELALYAGTLDITSDAGTLTDCGMEVTIDVPTCVVWEDSTRPDKLHGVPPCATMRVWVAPLCSSDENEGEWIDAKVSACSEDETRTITFNVNYVPAHIVMFAIFKMDWLTGGSK